MNCRQFVHQVAVGTAVAALAAVAHADTIYVDDDNCPGPGSGTEGDPYCSIQTAIDNAVDTDEIVVAPGTYFETIDFDGKAITVRSSGGAAATTINGTGAYHVVQCVSGEGPDTILEGVTITGGNANGAFPNDCGGGIIIQSSSPTVTNCVFSGNSASDDGGGMYSDEASDPTVTSCTFSGNEAGYSGGGMYNFESHATVTGCTFSGNSAPRGGGMSNIGYDSTVTNCTFSGNTASVEGGGMYNGFISNPTVTNCAFTGNTASGDGGGMSNFGGSPTVANCSFTGNTASGDGGGMYTFPGYPTVINCILWGDTPNEVGGEVGVVSFSDVQGGFSGIGNIDADPMLVDPDNADFRLSPGSPCIDAGMSLAMDTDLDGNQRAVDDPATPDTGIGYGGPVCDMGAYEFGSMPPCPADIDRNGTVNVNDFLALLANWGTCP